VSDHDGCKSQRLVAPPLLHRVAPAKLLLFRGPKAAFLGAAIDAPRKNIDVFVDEALGALVDFAENPWDFPGMAAGCNDWHL